MSSVTDWSELPWLVFKADLPPLNSQNPTPAFSKVTRSFTIKCTVLYSDGELQFAWQTLCGNTMTWYIRGSQRSVFKVCVVTVTFALWKLVQVDGLARSIPLSSSVISSLPPSMLRQGIISLSLSFSSGYWQPGLFLSPLSWTWVPPIWHG